MGRAVGLGSVTGVFRGGRSGPLSARDRPPALLAARLGASVAAYRDRALPADLREMRRFLHEPGEGAVGPWGPF